jgi:hypothetical protein
MAAWMSASVGGTALRFRRGAWDSDRSLEASQRADLNRNRSAHPGCNDPRAAVARPGGGVVPRDRQTLAARGDRHSLDGRTVQELPSTSHGLRPLGREAHDLVRPRNQTLDPLTNVGASTLKRTPPECQSPQCENQGGTTIGCKSMSTMSRLSGGPNQRSTTSLVEASGTDVLAYYPRAIGP